jgi:streptogramin lyase
MNAGAVLFLAAQAAGLAFAQSWPHYAADARRSSRAASGLRDFTAILWVTSQDTAGEALWFVGPAGPVIHDRRAYANARHYAGTVHVQNKIVAMDIDTGDVLFQTFIDKGVLDSWSSPAVDQAHNAILIGSGARLYSIDAATGVVNWSTPLARSVVNASPAVREHAVVGRAFITDYDGFGAAGSLYCINTAPFSSKANPYQPGQIVWQEPIGGSSGNTPAYENGVVYVASLSGSSPGCEDFGHLHAFSVDAPAASRRLWSTCVAESFLGGVTVANGYLYAAGYNFDGTGDNSTLVKVNALDGLVQWMVPCERTASIPVVDGGRIYLSAGLPGFGSAPKVQAFEDHGTYAVKLWDTYNDTAGTFLVGGWTHQPCLAGGYLCVGRIPTSGGFFGPYTDIYLLDPALTPADTGFIYCHRYGVGSSPAITAGRVYSLGPAGFHAVAVQGDLCNSDGYVDARDIQCFVAALTSPWPSAQEISLADFTGDGRLDIDDVPYFTDRALTECCPLSAN